MKVLVTGAAGFLGRALLERLVRRGADELHGADHQPIPHGTWHRCDLLDAAAVTRLIQTVRPDQTYHLAGTFANEFDTDWANNVMASRHLLEAVRTLGRGSRLLLVGSAAEYGCVQPEENPIREDHPLAPVSIYGWSKVCQTHLMGYYHRVQQVPVVMARVFNLTGAGASRRLFVGQMQEQIERLRAGQIPAIVTGNLEAQRDYLPVAEAAAQMEAIMERGLAGQVYHIGSGAPTTMRDLLRALLAEHGLTMDVVRIEPRPDADKLDIPVIYADLSKTRAL